MSVKTVDMVRKIRDRNYEKTKQMGHKDRIAYYHEGSEKLRQKLMVVKEEQAKYGSDSKS